MSQLPRFLMCPPTFFDVTYVINTWMEGHVAGVDKNLAQAQWQALHDAISTHGEVALIDPASGLPDMPFTANAGVVLGNVFVPSRFSHAERRGEESHFERWFAEAGFRVLSPPEGLAFEGAGDALLDRSESRLWMGHGHRTERACAEVLQDMLDVEVIPLKLADARFYHLDTCFCPLQGGYLMYYPGAFDEESQARIASHVPAERRLAVSEQDAAAFACNAVDVGGTVFINRSSTELEHGLRAFGYQTMALPLGEFMKSGGSAKCLTLRLDETR